MCGCEAHKYVDTPFPFPLPRRQSRSRPSQPRLVAFRSSQTRVRHVSRVPSRDVHDAVFAKPHDVRELFTPTLFVQQGFIVRVLAGVAVEPTGLRLGPHLGPHVIGPVHALRSVRQHPQTKNGVLDCQTVGHRGSTTAPGGVKNEEVSWGMGVDRLITRSYVPYHDPSLSLIHI